MHILFTAYEFVTERRPCGGCGNYLANIATVLSQHNHKVTILLLSDHNGEIEWKKNVRIVAFKYEYVNSVLDIDELIHLTLNVDTSEYVNKSLAFHKKIQEIHKRDKIDIIQHNGDHLECWHRCWNIPTVVRLSSFTPWCKQAYNPRSDMKDLSWLDTWDTRLFLYPLRKADAVYSPSNCVARFVNSKLSNKVNVIESPFMPEKQQEIRVSMPQLEGKKYLLFFGRLCVLKGINIIISSIHQILKENQDFYFVFAGNPEQKGMVNRILNAADEFKERVIILGEIKDKTLMQSIIKESYACVLPSRADNLSNSCIEAMGLGKIVIGTYGASFEQLIQNKKNGLLIKRDSSAALMKAIRYLNSMTYEMRKEMEEHAIERIKKMQPELIYEKVIGLYEEVIYSKKHRRPK